MRYSAVSLWLSVLVLASCVFASPVPYPPSAESLDARSGSNNYDYNNEDLKHPSLMNEAYADSSSEDTLQTEIDTETEIENINLTGELLDENNTGTTGEDVTDPRHRCYNACKVQMVEGARTEREALCSRDGLRATYACAKCIDTLWPDSAWEDSALAEYDRIVLSCSEE